MKKIKQFAVALASSLILLIAFFWATTDNRYVTVDHPAIERPGYETTPAMVDIYPSAKMNYQSHGKTAVVIFFVLISLNFGWDWFTSTDRHLSKKPVDRQEKPTKGQRTTLGIVGFAIIWLSAGACIYGLVHAPKGINYITKKEITKERFDSFGGSKDSLKALFK